MTISNSKIVVKHTMLLYIRMFVLMIISLITSRMVLRLLGASDYGLYNVVGGFISFFFVFSGTMSTAVLRFMSFEIGRNNDTARKVVFTQSVIIFTCMAFVFMIIGLAIGIPFVKYQLNVDSGRESAAIFVLLWSLLTAFLQCVKIPFNSALLAYEHFSTYAWLSILEGVLKLFLLIPLYFVTIDKLSLYAFFQFLVSFIVTLLFSYYCISRFHDFTTKNIRDKKVLKEILKFSSWSFLQSSSNLLLNQGFNIILNQFFGTLLNAARGLSTQIQGTIASFASNIQSASSPAITKVYAANEREQTKKMFFQFSKLAYILFAMVAFPVLFVLRSLLNLWLGEGYYPEYTIEFTYLVVIGSLANTLSGSSHTLILATGNVKYYNIYYTLIQLLSLFFSYCVIRIWGNPIIGYIVLVFFSFVIATFQIWKACFLNQISVLQYVINVVIPDFVVTFMIVLALFSISKLLPFQDIDWYNAFFNGIIYLIIVMFISYSFGFNHDERQKAKNLARIKILSITWKR